MTNKIILLITVLAYAVVVSQSFMYILALKNTQLALGGGAYTEVRQLIDANMKVNFKYVMYGALIASLLLVVANFNQRSGILFITASIAFVALLADAIFTLKGNVPLNNVINSWSPGNFPANWTEVRQQWFTILQYRQVINIVGFVSLLIGTVFGRS